MKDLVARALTEIAAPWTVNIASCLILGFAIGHPGWGAFVALFAGVLPMALIVWGMVRDRIGNHHVTEHSERHGLIGAILALVLVALIVQLVAQGPKEMIALTCAGLVTLVGIGVWTSGVGVKASVHMGVWCGVVAVLAVALSAWWWTGLILAPAIAWSRMRLKHHTGKEIAVGADTGLVIAPLTYLAIVNFPY
ncbi:hypothetical protein LQ384_23445 [Rhodococcus rhodochrous]|uniref:Uncharacterized protein n=1 Tax=Rhodococcus rhodochrous TaxID=1829 RepID=A0AAW4XN28_RHORH|nr:hypothetical protein [Rhodococcus rhodochrous]MCD2114075.1 hypothetical protein [Rhodococcus rhodochrous]